MNEKQMQQNDIRLKDAYRKKNGLLTSTEIIGIREKSMGLAKAIYAFSLDGAARPSQDMKAIRCRTRRTKVTSLYKVKLMKLMWYADALSYKRRGFAITGLIYQALQMGAVPVGHNSIIDLKDVPCEEVDIGETSAYHFSLKNADEFPYLSVEEKEILDIVIEKLGWMSKNEIVDFMHREQAYVKTAPRDIIQFSYAESLQI